MNAAARVVSGTHKFDRLLYTELHWLNVPDRVVYKLGVMMFNCLHGQAPPYTSWNCASRRCRITATSPIRHLTASRTAPPARASMADGLSVWLLRRSGIPCRTACGIRLLAGTVSDNFWRRFCSQCTDAFSALEVSRRCAIDFLLTK